MLRSLCLAIVLAVGTTGTAAEKVPPAVEVRLRALSDMLDVFDYLGKILPPEVDPEGYLKMAKLIGESKTGFLGLDPTKPAGAYVGIATEVADSPVVLMVPVAKQSDFLGLLRTYLKLDPKKLKDDLYSFALPKVPAGPAYIRFAHGYAYVTIRSAESIDPDRIIPPEVFFKEKPTDILNAKVFIDRFPADIRKSILGQLELGWHEVLEGFQGTALELAQRKFLVDVGTDMVKTFIEEGDSIDVALRIAPKSDDIEAKLVLKPKAGTGLAKFLKNQSTRDNRAASMFSESIANTVITNAYSIELPPQTRKKVADLADRMIEDTIAERKLEGEDKTDARELQRIARAILLAGDLQGSYRAGGDPATKKLETGMATAVVEGNALEKVVRRLLARHEIDRVKLDAHKPDDYRYHTVANPLAGPDDQPFVMATGDKLWVLATTLSELQDSLKRKPKSAPFLLMEIFYGTGAFTSFDTKDLHEKHFGKPVPPGSDRMFLRIDGGDALTVEAGAKGRVVVYTHELDNLKKKQKGN